MLLLNSILLASLSVAGSFGYPDKISSKRSSITSSETGTNNGYYFSFYTDDGGDVEYNNESEGEYTVTWTDCGDFVAGKGWSTGSAR